LQAACHFLFESYANGLGPDERPKFLQQEYREEATPHLSDYWHNSDDHEKIVLTALALLEPQAKQSKTRFSRDECITCILIRSNALGWKRCLLASRNDTFALLNSALGEWIVGEITIVLDDQPAYADWLKSNQGAMERLSTRARSELGEILPKISGKYRDLIITWASDPRNLLTVAGLLRSVVGLGWVGPFPSPAPFAWGGRASTMSNHKSYIASPAGARCSLAAGTSLALSPDARRPASRPVVVLYGQRRAGGPRAVPDEPSPRARYLCIFVTAGLALRS
jgi:hypothetical protein